MGLLSKAKLDEILHTIEDLRLSTGEMQDIEVRMYCKDDSEDSNERFKEGARRDIPALFRDIKIANEEIKCLHLIITQLKEVLLELEEERKWFGAEDIKQHRLKSIKFPPTAKLR